MEFAKFGGDHRRYVITTFCINTNAYTTESILAFGDVRAHGNVYRGKRLVASAATIHTSNNEASGSLARSETINSLNPSSRVANLTLTLRSRRRAKFDECKSSQIRITLRLRLEISVIQIRRYTTRHIRGKRLRRCRGRFQRASSSRQAHVYLNYQIIIKLEGDWEKFNVDSSYSPPHTGEAFRIRRQNFSRHNDDDAPYRQ